LKASWGEEKSKDDKYWDNPLLQLFLLAGFVRRIRKDSQNLTNILWIQPKYRLIITSILGTGGGARTGMEWDAPKKEVEQGGCSAESGRKAAGGSLDLEVKDM
jgi:hypothetical protein